MHKWNKLINNNKMKPFYVRPTLRKVINIVKYFYFSSFSYKDFQLYNNWQNRQKHFLQKIYHLEVWISARMHILQLYFSLLWPNGLMKGDFMEEWLTLAHSLWLLAMTSRHVCGQQWLEAVKVGTWSLLGGLASKGEGRPCWAAFFPVPVAFGPGP